MKKIALILLSLFLLTNIMGVVGNLVDIFGSSLGLPEWGISEALNSGHPTVNTTISPVNKGGIGPSMFSGQGGGQSIVNTQPQNPQQGQTLGVSTGGSGGGGGGGQQQQQQAPAQRTPYMDWYDQAFNSINSAWDAYNNSLGQISGYLGDQRTSQENIANSQFTQGQDVINRQKATSLRDIANTTKSAFQAGNNYLGSLGAGDSSGANQYSFAINQQAGKQTGDLNNFVSGQISNLQAQHDQQIQQIAGWFANAQQELKQQMAQGQLGKGQDLASLSRGMLDQAISATNQIKANTQNQYNALVQWAASNSTNMGQLQQNIAQIPQAMGQLSMVGGAPASNRLAYGGSVPNQNDKTDIFGNSLA